MYTYTHGKPLIFRDGYKNEYANRYTLSRRQQKKKTEIAAAFSRSNQKMRCEYNIHRLYLFGGGVVSRFLFPFASTREMYTHTGTVMYVS